MVGKDISPVAVEMAALIAIVLAAVEFNDESKLEASEVGEVGPDRVLATKSEAQQSAAAKVVPESSLCIRGVTAQMARKVPCRAGESHA